jgi:hypothetical protein
VIPIYVLIEMLPYVIRSRNEFTARFANAIQIHSNIHKPLSWIGRQQLRLIGVIQQLYLQTVTTTIGRTEWVFWMCIFVFENELILHQLVGDRERAKSGV